MKKRVTVAMDSELLRAVNVKADRTGSSESGVIEDALRRSLGFDLLRRLRALAQLGGREAMELAQEGRTAARHNAS